VTRAAWARRCAAGIAALPACAAAHSPIAGIGHFYSGAAHPFVSPAHLIALLTLGLWVGQRLRIDADPNAIVGFALALLLGLALHRVAGDPDTGVGLLGASAVAGVALAAAWDAPRWLLLLQAVGVGLGLGLASGPDGADGTTRWVSLSGTWFGAMLAFAYLVLIGKLSARHAVARIALRVVGSWLAAAALLVLALSLAPQRAPARADGPSAGDAPAYRSA
jgi:hydrogenase/urease accessory protein HupE